MTNEPMKVRINGHLEQIKHLIEAIEREVYVSEEKDE